MPHRKLTIILLAASVSLFPALRAQADVSRCHGRVIDVAARETRAEEAVHPDVYAAVEDRSEIRHGSIF